ncbi:MAG: hypothetical protein JOZ96_15955 [Acidobacteria bacterium]|nr:hypothetical protein [Acidobacteriota bacterium]
MSNMNMPSMLAYTVRSSLSSNNPPSAIISYGRDATNFTPAKSQDDSYWICILNAKNPRERVKEWVIPGTSNAQVPAGIDTYMNDPDYIFVVSTQYLSTMHVPQGDFYDFLVKYGAGRELQRLEQVNTVLGCGSFSRMSYVLTGACGPRGGKNVPPPSYEMGSYTNYPAMLLMSLMPMPGGGPPYSICNSYTFRTR